MARKARIPAELPVERVIYYCSDASLAHCAAVATRLWSYHQDLLERYGMQREDVMQEITTEVLQRLQGCGRKRGFDPARGASSTWVVLAARDAARHLLRKLDGAKARLHCNTLRPQDNPRSQECTVVDVYTL